MSVKENIALYVEGPIFRGLITVPIFDKINIYDNIEEIGSSRNFAVRMILQGKYEGNFKAFEVT